MIIEAIGSGVFVAAFCVYVCVLTQKAKKRDKK